ncbi:MAG: hypothetical protein HN995_01080 [Candidatus Marinimicrobia bacterium]|jgi:hypothetical protein|nr:hypothetical protein [Candidatus Neomarinimicrobiota bacterium]MBT3678777.1 hypothetical protein [Candidatus Neomarinimicrobiota bacterium]MBT5236101.1 hypothetical protein [Candidatus Neomarinimicrobiota bacterium]MBT5786346.1 hypothetical protein [Candidatus Neomarinimicrobiota bacterium]MBT5996903.1 hypothetical protein [Candidatus Neomarinimicrobiota bacterium]
MRPNNSKRLDDIDKLLENSWENPPAQFEQQLMAIPSQLALAQNRKLDRISLFLNAILMVWGAGLVMFFWTPVNRMIVTLSQGVLGISVLSPQLLMNPVVGLIALTCLMLGWVWMDMEKHPGVTKA